MCVQKIEKAFPADFCCRLWAVGTYSVKYFLRKLASRASDRFLCMWQFGVRGPYRFPQFVKTHLAYVFLDEFLGFLLLLIRSNSYINYVLSDYDFSFPFAYVRLPAAVGWYHCCRRRDTCHTRYWLGEHTRCSFKLILTDQP